MSETSPEVRARRSRLAVASLVLGLLGLVTCGLGSLVGLILGIAALVSIKRSDGRLGGRGLAVTGLCVSVLILILAPVLTPTLVAIVRFKSWSAGQGGRNECVEHLQAIAAASRARAELAREETGEPLWPDSLAALREPAGEAESGPAALDPAVLRCPGRAQAPPATGETDYESLFDRAGFRIRGPLPGPADVPLAWDKPGNHPDGFHVVFFDGHAVFFGDDETGAEWARFQARVDAWIAEHKPEKGDTDASPAAPK